MIKNLIFDFGKVLVDYSFDRVIDGFFVDVEEREQFKNAICGPEFIDKCDKEDIPFEQIVKEAQITYPQWKRPLQLFYDHYLDFVIGEVHGMRDLLQRLRAEGFRLYGLTNWCSVVHRVIEKFDILQLLDDRIISSEEHLIKPDVAIYQRLCEKFQLVPEECLFTDDKLVNVEGAQKAGLQAILFHDAEQYERELRLFLQTQSLNVHNKEEFPPAHTAEHLLNQTMVRMFGCERSNNAHIERKKSKINYKLASQPTEDQVEEIEQIMNDLINEGLPVTYEFVTRESIPAGVKLDRLPQNASEQLRIVRIGDYDVCPCVGKHVASTSEIGRFEITSTSYKEGDFRIVYRVFP